MGAGWERGLPAEQRMAGAARPGRRVEPEGVAGLLRPGIRKRPRGAGPSERGKRRGYEPATMPTLGVLFVRARTSYRQVSVSVPESIDNVEEYLLSGVQPSQIQWVA